MKEQDLTTFIHGTRNYFSCVMGSSPEIGTPYLFDFNPIQGDFTASIHVRGLRKGSVFFTAKREMIQGILEAFGEKNFNDELIADMVGEIANTIAGNARESLGSGFMISVPSLIAGSFIHRKADHAHTALVIPIHWKGHACHVVIALDESVQNPGLN
jgi:chemotaxis protein CheX